MIAFLMAIEDEKKRSKLEKIYIEYHKAIYVTAYSILKDHYEAEDVVQDAVFRLADNLHKISEIKCKKTLSYLVIIVRNLSYNVYNKRKGLALLEHDEVKRIPDNETILIEERIIQMDFSSEMAKYLQQIHPPYADILTLRYYHELKVYEIAKVLDISENNTSVRINRALMALRKVLEEEGVNYERKTV